MIKFRNTPAAKKLWTSAFILLGLIYFLNCFSPLRLTHDSLRYLLIQEWMENGRPRGTWVDHDYLPYGYSAFLFLLAKLHLYGAFFIAFANTLYLAGSILFFRGIIGKGNLRATAVLFVLINWITIKLAITPLSEMQFLFFSTGSLYFFVTYRRRGTVSDLFLSGIFFAGAILTRTVGFLLPVAMLIDILLEHRRHLARWGKKSRWALVILAVTLLVMIFTLRELRISAYFGYLVRPLSSHGSFYFFQNFLLHLRGDWAEVFINVPASKLTAIPNGVVYTVYGMVGGALLFLIIFQIWKDKQALPPAARYYFLLYMSVIFCWPYHECRFWLPLLPCIGQLISRVSLPKGAWPLSLARAAGTWYLAAGLFALGYYTYTSFNHEQLAIRQDAGVWRKEYEAHFSAQPAGEHAPLDPVVMRVLDRTK
jgi:hypothetical protein